MIFAAADNKSDLYQTIISDAFLVGVASTLAAGLIAGLAHYSYKRYHVRQLLLLELNEHIRLIASAVNDLTQVIENKLVVGQPLLQAGRFIPAKSSFFPAFQGGLFSLFPFRIKQILSIHGATDTIQELIACLYGELTAEAGKANPIRASDKAYYEGKLVRIMIMIDQLRPLPFKDFHFTPNKEVTVEELRELIGDCESRAAQKNSAAEEAAPKPQP